MRLALLAFLLLAPQLAQAQSCPEPLASARRLVLVTADSFASTTASVQRYDRDAPNAPWQLSGGPASALIGHNGLAWAHAFRKFARKNEPQKMEGDKCAPAGFFAVRPPQQAGHRAWLAAIPGYAPRRLG